MRPLVLLALTLPAVAAAATVDPELVSGTLDPGESLDVDLVVDLSARTSETGGSDSDGTDMGYSGTEGACHVGVPHAQDGSQLVDDGESAGYTIVR